MKKVSIDENKQFLKELLSKELEKEFKTTNNKERIRKLIQAKYYVISEGGGIHSIFASVEINKDILKYLPEEELDHIHICPM
jgi:shikimate kinase